MFGESDSESPRVPSPWDALHPQGVPKLVPEVEEGNVEYKLQLLSPSPARFARLVTQLKWRLLEGGGQAYYELGVADSGMLVGLARQQLEESLETLELMAGEIGASVIVVKEIQVPPEMSSLAESQLERWDGRRSTRRKDRLRMIKYDEDSSTTELETTDADESTCHSPAASPALLADEPIPDKPNPPSHLDPALPSFTIDLGDDVADYADSEAQDDPVGLEIAPVYKPRPMGIHTTHPDSNKRVKKNGHPPSCHTANPLTQGNPEALQTSGATSQLHRSRRDKRRVMKLDALLTHLATCRATESPSTSADHPPPCSTDDSHSSVTESPPTIAVDPQTADATGTMSKEPRLIVEALVVRKLSLDEAFLDFEGFSLQ